MKLTVISSDYKCCATCQYWEGKRNLTFDGNNVQFYLEDHGICSSAQSLCNLKEQKGKAICTYWTRWYLIR